MLRWSAQQTARGLARGKVYMASMGDYTLIGSRERGDFSVTVLRDAITIYHEQHDHPAYVALKMVEVWNMLRQKMLPTGTYRRITL